MNIVKELRRKKGIQQKQLAIEIGVSCPTVSEWETGKKDPRGDNLKKLASFFNVDELVVLGKGTTNINVPQSVEARIVSGGMDRMNQSQREQVLAVVKAMFAQHPELFEEDENT